MRPTFDSRCQPGLVGSGWRGDQWGFRDAVSVLIDCASLDGCRDGCLAVTISTAPGHICVTSALLSTYNTPHVSAAHASRAVVGRAHRRAAQEIADVLGMAALAVLQGCVASELGEGRGRDARTPQGAVDGARDHVVDQTLPQTCHQAHVRWHGPHKFACCTGDKPVPGPAWAGTTFRVEGAQLGACHHHTVVCLLQPRGNTARLQQQVSAATRCQRAWCCRACSIVGRVSSG
mmetsp:Transcript_59491/g.98005  ORF Transcript_59491/g.98005 Transcript_59491/m.98005 type:complete len:233 (-) Transcript_59491:57-755(-)